MLVSVSLACASSPDGKQRPWNSAPWKQNPLENPEECGSLEPLPLCSEVLIGWVEESTRRVSQFASERPIDANTMRRVRQAASCWLRANGYTKCGESPCLVVSRFGAPDDVTAWFFYENAALVRSETAQIGGYTYRFLSSTTTVTFKETRDGIVWLGPPEWGETCRPCQVSIRKAFQCEALK